MAETGDRAARLVIVGISSTIFDGFASDLSLKSCRLSLAVVV